MNPLAKIRPHVALVIALATVAAIAHADPLTDDKKHALGEFVAAYRLAEVWPQMAPKIARDSLPRLEDAVRADIDADALPSAERRAAAQARVERLLPAGRQDLETALRAFDADELAVWTAFEIYGKYFEIAEIREITSFFDSDTGRKVSTLGPTLIAESRKPGAGDVMARHFSDLELQQITAFWHSPVGVKMNETAAQVREDMHAHFVEKSEATVQAVARRIATRAEADDASATVPPAPPANP